jgi:hypothetical protein
MNSCSKGAVMTIHQLKEKDKKREVIFLVV